MQSSFFLNTSGTAVPFHVHQSAVYSTIIIPYSTMLDKEQGCINCTEQPAEKVAETTEANKELVLNSHILLQGYSPYIKRTEGSFD